MNTPHNRRAFTLIELLVVIVFIAVMASVIIPAYANFRRKMEFRGQLREIQDVFAYAREQAVSKDTTASVSFEQQSGTFIANVTPPPPLSDQPAQFASQTNPEDQMTAAQIAPVKAQLDPRYEVMPVADPSGANGGSSSASVFHFRSDGTVEGGSIMLADKTSGYTGKLKLWPATGRMTLEEDVTPQ